MLRKDCENMCVKNTKNLLVGVLIGMAAGMCSCCMMKNQKKMKKKAGRAVQAMGDLIDDVKYMFK